MPGSTVAALSAPGCMCAAKSARKAPFSPAPCLRPPCLPQSQLPPVTFSKPWDLAITVRGRRSSICPASEEFR